MAWSVKIANGMRLSVVVISVYTQMATRTLRIARFREAED